MVQNSRIYVSAAIALICALMPSLSSAMKIYFENSSAKWSQPKVHYWGGSSSTEWPGDDMTLKSGTIWEAEIPDNSTGIVLNQGNDTGKSGDLTPVANHVYTNTGDTGKTYEQYNAPLTNTVYYHNTKNWSNVYVWKWSGSETGTWSGPLEVDAETGLYYYTQNPAPDFLLFTNQNNWSGVSKTCDFNWADGAVYAYKEDNKTKNDPQYVSVEDWNDVMHPTPSTLEPTGTLPVLHINIYNGSSLTDISADKATLNDGITLNNIVLDKDLSDKDYRPGAYWISVPDEVTNKYSSFAIGSEEKPLLLEMKARGNFTRKGFSKKPFKLKFDKKQNIGGMMPAGTKSKHWAILTHADDATGYLKNFVGFNLGKKMGLPWTPGMQPIEVIINGDYRGIYFLTESIRVESGRVEIAELEDNETLAPLVSGGYMVELDNYFDDPANQIYVTPGNWSTTGNDRVWITPDTPEIYSDVQKKFVKEQFTTMHNYIKTSDDSEIWKYMDLDDAARYYIVEEIIGHYEAYHGSTYLFRDRGEGNKWHFSPLWDCGHAFDTKVTTHFYNQPGSYGNTWITDLVNKTKFMNKVKETWKWFMQNCYVDLFTQIDSYIAEVKQAAIRDADRWRGVEQPTHTSEVTDTRDVTDNSDIDTDKATVKNYLTSRLEWLSELWGDYTSDTFSEPERDDTPAAPLPDYVKPLETSGTLPVLHINVYNQSKIEKITSDGITLNSGLELDNSILDKDLQGKDKKAATFWITIPDGVNDKYGAYAMASESEPAFLLISPRGNYTRTGFSKKPYKLKFQISRSLCGINKSKSWTLLTHADDCFGYLRNFVGFNIGKRIGLPWTPEMQPVEVIINDDYRGIYFLTESRGVGSNKINIEELDDNVRDPILANGGYLVELDNYTDDPGTIRVAKSDDDNKGYDDVFITPETPEEYSELQKWYVSDQFSTMHGLVKTNSPFLWSYMDIDDAARYYIVEELLGHYEAYHGSTFLFKDRGTNQKWHFSPLWDCGHAFDTDVNTHFYDNSSSYGNTWITDMVKNEKFMSKVKETWKWFMANCYYETNEQPALTTDIDAFVEEVKQAAIQDHKRWGDAPLPVAIGNNNPSAVEDNSDMETKKTSVKDYLADRIAWLNGLWGTDEYADEPERDKTIAPEVPTWMLLEGALVPETGYTLYFDNSDKWTETPTCYAWDIDNNAVLDKWPGTLMQPVHGVEDLWSISVPNLPAGVIFCKNNTDKSDANKWDGGDGKAYANHIYKKDGSCKYASIRDIYFIDRSSTPWENVNIHYAQFEKDEYTMDYQPLGEKPGKAMMYCTDHDFGHIYGYSASGSGGAGAPRREAASNVMAANHYVLVTDRPEEEDLTRLTFINSDNTAEERVADINNLGIYVRSADGSISTDVKEIETEMILDGDFIPEEYIDLTGCRISKPAPGSIVIVRSYDKYKKVKL